MYYIVTGFRQAILLLLHGDPLTYSAILTSLKVSSLSITGSLFIGLPFGFLLGFYDFPLKKALRTIVDTLLALPTVVVGLFVYALISQSGPFGKYRLLYTIYGIAIAQTILILPIVISLTATAVESLEIGIKDAIITLGANRKRVALSVLYESRYGVLTAGVAAYGRALSEVGISMIVGGNIKWFTRTITTAIALETGKGNFSMGIALGIVLLILAFAINGFVVVLRRRMK